AEQIRSIELEGYVVLPDLLVPETVEEILDEMSRLPTRGVDYSPHQRTCSNLQWTHSPTTIETIAHRPMIDFLQDLFGDELICTSCSYTCAEPGHPGIVIHTDSQPYGSKIFGVQASSPVLARVLYYLDDQTPECSPFKVVPRSHLSMHRDGNPYNRYLSHPDEVMVICKAGSAVVINQKVFHGNYPNHSNQPRRMLAIAYRPAWAGPIGPVEDRNPDQVAGLPAHIQPFFRSLNTQAIDFEVPNRPDNMPREAPGIAPSRWNRR
ncbi:MAG: phytanoyl-CoA dioxygenase family protein, partial [Verrucomicrobiae bacterium]|nr:phytanoyl-CoA dioxygenase family protein [Verrucomicrobiae bacterium]